MLLAERSVAPYRFRHGNGVLLVSMPHAGTFVPHSVGRAFNDVAALRPDTDWHMAKLYDFAHELDASVIVANYSRYVIDVNRPPGGENLYPGRDTPLLCPVDTFDCQPLYREGGNPSKDQIERRVEGIWKPYHRRLAAELERIREAHGIAVLWDAHSIVSQAPRLFEGRLPDFNLGTADDASCDPGLSQALIAALQRHAGHTCVLNGRFKGGYITRRFGRPAEGVHAVQLEMAQCLYMDEKATVPISRRLGESNQTDTAGATGNSAALGTVALPPLALPLLLHSFAPRSPEQPLLSSCRTFISPRWRGYESHRLRSRLCFRDRHPWRTRNTRMRRNTVNTVVTVTPA
jgi:N-formylglutamate deformylase